VRSEGAKLKSALTQGIDQAIGCIYQGIERAFAARYQEEFSALQTMRGATANEVAEALAALGDASEECASLREALERQKDEFRSAELSLNATRQNLTAMREELGQQTNTSMELRLASLRSESLLEAAKTEVARAQADRCAADPVPASSRSPRYGPATGGEPRARPASCR
jgi:chromosome segregation ATPase